MGRIRTANLQATIADLQVRTTALLREMQALITSNGFADGNRHAFSSTDENDLIAFLHRVHKVRQKAFGQVFKDESWFMLLDLLKSEADGTSINVSALCATTHRSQARALRMIHDLECSGFIERRPDPTDGRRILVSSTEKARESMCRLLGYAMSEIEKRVRPSRPRTHGNASKPILPPD